MILSLQYASPILLAKLQPTSHPAIAPRRNLD